MKILVTGAAGFIGLSLTERLARDADHNVVGIIRKKKVSADNDVQFFIGPDLSRNADWSGFLEEVEVVIHLAARAHILNDTELDPLDAFRAVNFHGTLNLARQALGAGVRRFIFISSIGVNGDRTLAKPFREEDAEAPHSPYAVSKYEAEIGLKKLSADTGLDVVIIRPPLVYGPNAPGNFGSLMHWLRRGIPLPLGAVHNQRSLVALDNLVDLIVTCLTHPSAANQTFLVSDGEDVSTTELLRRMGQALGRPARLIPVPASWLKLAATLMGKQDVAQRLCGSLQVDIEKTRRLLGWTPPLSLDQGLRRAAAGD
jgi:nucleoside-diphosphate-sugar epimerase